MTLNTPVLTAIFLFLALFPSSSSACDARDTKALIAFKNSFVSTSLSDIWLDSTDCCSWEQVLCDSTTGRVTSLDLWKGVQPSSSDVFLNGTIPASIGDLSALDTLIFTNLQGLVGPIPHQITKLKKLKYLWITKTGVSGPVPSFLSKLTSLQQLLLAGNRLSGKIPSSLGSLVNLNYIGLYDNQLTGSIPASLYSKLSQGLKPYLQLYSNKLTGPIPPSFGDIDFLEIDLYDNKLVGDASFLFGKSKTRLQTINVTRNRLEFDLSNVVFPASLEILDISHNKIYGSIPDQILETDLWMMDVSYNQLCGKIPSGGNFPLFDKKYYAHNKCLCGAPLQPCKL